MDKQSQIVALRTAETVEQEAADWLTRLDRGRLSSAERASLRAWLEADTEHARALKNLVAIWSDMDVLLNEFPAAVPNASPDSFLWFGAKRLRYALAALLLCVAGALAWMMAKPVPTETSFLVTSIGKQQVETFGDGSTAHLNTNSMLEIEFSESMRIIRLLQGEALFDVARDPERPFIVYAGDSQVMALGTKFVVRLDSKNVVVTVTDGQVQLSKRTKRKDSVVPEQQEVVLVSKGEEVLVDNATPAPQPKEIQTDELERRLSWLKGQLVFKNERLEQVVAEVSRYVPNRIVIDDPELRDVRISGRFEIGDTEALLQAIEVSFNVKANHIDENSIHLSR